MGKSSGTIDLESVQKFYQWLQGGDGPESIDFKANPNLTAEEAFSVIYYLQEELEILPDTYEQCRECKCLFDSEEEGVSIGELGFFPEELYGMYCDDCRPDQDGGIDRGR